MIMGMEAGISVEQRQGLEAFWKAGGTMRTRWTVSEIVVTGDIATARVEGTNAVTAPRERCSIALAGNHDYGVTGSVEPSRLGPVADRATALKFLVHFIGDLHQPFHALGVGRGGNDVHVRVFGEANCGKDADKLNEALDSVSSWVKQNLK